ncbi:MAG: flagellar filament capping protein FliD [Rhodoferax sp.]
MAAISSLGIGSNLDLTTLLANLKSGEQSALVPMQKQQISFTSKLTAYGQLNSALSGLQTAATALSKAELFQGVKASSSDSAVLSATASASAASGTYAVNVTQLTQAHSLAAAGVASTSAKIGADVSTTVTIDFGTISGGTLGTDGKYTGATVFTPPAVPPTAASITIDSSNNTLAGIRDAINASTTLGVTASIINDGDATSPNRLVLTSKQSGEASSMRITVAGDTAIRDLLANNPAGGVPAAQLQQTAVAQNTKLTVNGIAVTSATNSVAGAVQDVTMTVSKIGSSTLTVAKDTSSVQSAITTFVNAYNSLQSVSKQLSAFDTTKKTGAALLGDSVLRNIQVGIRSALTSPQTADSTGLTMLSEIGVAFQKDGTLLTDATKLTAALGSKLSGVANLFSGNAGVGGYGTQLAALITTYTDTTGTLSSATKGINSSLDKLSKQYTATTERIDATVARYKAQFTQLDQMISRMNQTSSYLTQQFDAINNTTTK